MTQSQDYLSRQETETDYIPGGRPITGAKALAIFVGLFVIVIIANGALSYFAIKTFSGEVIPHPYERGLAYNHDIAAARAQISRGWQVDVELTPHHAPVREISVTILNAAGERVAGLQLQAQFAAPADLTKDVTVSLEEKANGQYMAQISPAPGLRDLTLTAKQRGKEVFRSKNRIDASPSQ